MLAGLPLNDFDRKHAILLFAPHVFPVTPYLSTALLKAYINANGLAIEQDDLNPLYFETIFSEDFIERQLQEIEGRISEIEEQQHISAAQAFLLASLLESRCDLAYVKSKAYRIIDILRSAQEFYDPDKYQYALQLAAVTMSALSVKWFPSAMKPDAFRSRFSPFSASQINAFLQSPQEDPYWQFYLDDYRPPQKQWSNYYFVGLSVAFPDQVLPAFSLAKAIKAASPNTFICMGGNVISRIGDAISAQSGLFKYIDCFCVGEGENPLLNLLKALRSGNAEPIPDGIVMNTENGIHFTRNQNTLKARDLPTPDFSGLPLKRYLSPELVFPTLTFKGCSYGKCTFCDHHVNYAVVSGRPGEKVAADLLTLNQRFGARRFNFVDEEMPPNHARGVGRELVKHAALRDTRWMGYAIYRDEWDAERWKLLHDAGCREMLFGFESGSERVLEMMKKPLSIQTVARITHDMNTAGIASRVNIIIGFPGETISDSLKTLEYFRENKALFDKQGTLIAIHPFLMVRNAPLAFSELGQGIIERDAEFDLQLHYNYNIHRSAALQLQAGGEQLIDAELAYRLAASYSNQITEVYTEQQFPISRIHRFLYICNGQNIAAAPPAENGMSVDDHQVQVELFNLTPVQDIIDACRQYVESYEFWANFRSKRGWIYEHIKKHHAALQLERCEAMLFIRLYLRDGREQLHIKKQLMDAAMEELQII